MKPTDNASAPESIAGFFVYVDEDNQGEFDEETTLKYALNYCIDVIEDKETILDVNFLGDE